MLPYILPVVELSSLNESPSEKEGKSFTVRVASTGLWGLNESPSEKEGKSILSFR